MHPAESNRARAASFKRAGVIGLVAFALLGTLTMAAATAIEKYKRDPKAPLPPVVTPGEAGKAPSDAIVLFDGTDLSKWIARGRTVPKGTDGKPAWKIQDGYMEVVPDSGNLISKEKFTDSQIHVEWATPAETGRGQKGGNSGVILNGHAEVQVLDSYKNDTYPDGQAGSIYHYYPPLVNASRKPGEWQSFDMIYTAPRREDDKVIAPARLTVLHNGVVIQNNVEIPGDAADYSLMLQDHLNPVRYRNVWVRKLPPAQK
jgi:hypothetical protein